MNEKQIIKGMPRYNMPKLTLSDQAAILAGLRMLGKAMAEGQLPPDIEEILTDGNTLVPVNANDIDSLCDALNGNLVH